MVIILVLQEPELQLVSALIFNENLEVLFRFGLVVLDFLLDCGEQFFDFLVLLTFAECVGEHLLLLELRHEAVKNRLRPTDGSR